MKVQFRNTVSGKTETYDNLDRPQTTALVAFARTLGEPEMVELRVRIPGVTHRGKGVWVDVTDQF